MGRIDQHAIFHGGTTEQKRVTHAVALREVDPVVEERTPYSGPHLPHVTGAEPPGPADAAKGPSQPPRAPAGDLPLIMPDELQEEARAREEEDEPEPEPVVTETMAEVYARQGLFGEARHIYEQLLAQRPGDPELLRRIAALDARAVPERPDQREALAARFAASATGGQSLRAMLSDLARAVPAVALRAPTAAAQRSRSSSAIFASTTT